MDLFQFVSIKFVSIRFKAVALYDSPYKAVPAKQRRNVALIINNNDNRLLDDVMTSCTVYPR
jgi:hypothetical protein